MFSFNIGKQLNWVVLTADNCYQKFPFGIHTRLCVHEKNFHSRGCNHSLGCWFCFCSDIPQWMDGLTPAPLLEPHREDGCAFVISFMCASVLIFVCLHYSSRFFFWPHPNRHTGFLRGLSPTPVLIMASCLTVVAAIWCETLTWPVGFTAPSTGKWEVWTRTDSQNGCCVYRQLASFRSLGNVCVYVCEKFFVLKP